MQKTIENNIQVGVKGEFIKGLHSYQLQWSGYALDATIAPGDFVKVDETNANGIWKSSGVGVKTNEKIVGVALRHYISTCGTDVEAFPKGEAVFYAIKGCVWIETTAPAKIGQSVFIKNDDGTLVFNNAETLANHTYTGFKVLKSTSDTIAGGSSELVAIYK